VRADGTAHIVVDEAESQRALNLLTRRYRHYTTQRPGGPVVAIHIDRLTGWSAT